MKRKVYWALTILLAAVGVAFVWGIISTHQVALSEAKVQEQVDKQLHKDFQVKGKARFLVKSVNITEAKVRIEQGQVNADVNVKGRLIANKEFTISTQSVGVPSFENGGFYFRPDKIEIKDFSYQGDSPSKMISDEKKSNFLTKHASKAKEWITETAEASVTKALQNKEVYRPGSDFKGLLISASLKSVEIKDNNVVITFSLLQLTYTILTGFLFIAIAIGFVIFLIRNPGFGGVLQVVSFMIPDV
jgi:hypothetical protein